MKIKHLMTITFLLATTGFAEESLVEKFDQIVQEEPCTTLNSSFHEINYVYENSSARFPAKITLDYFGKYIALKDTSSEVLNGTLFVNFKTKKYYIYHSPRGGSQTLDSTSAKKFAIKFVNYFTTKLAKSTKHDQQKAALACVEKLTALIDTN